MNKDNHIHRPWWLVIVIILLLAPLFAWPGMVAEVLGNGDRYDMPSILVFIFPLYAVMSCYYAYKIYEARRELSIILLCVLLLSYAFLVFSL